MTARGRFVVSLVALLVPAAACSSPPPTAPTRPVLSTVSVASLPIEGSINSVMMPTDPGTYLGELQEGPYLDHVKRFVFFVSSDADLLIELDWSHMSGAALRMAIEDDGAMSAVSGLLQVIVLPRGKRGTLLVGLEDGPRSQVVPFTLSTHRIGG